MTIQFPRPTGTPSLPSVSSTPRLNSGTVPVVPMPVPPLPGTPAPSNTPSLLKLKDGINNAGAFNPVQEGVFAKNTNKPGNPRNSELAQSIQQIIKALEAALPPNPPAHLEAAIDKLKALHERLEGALENSAAPEAQAANEASQSQEAQAAEAPQEAGQTPETQEAEASQEASEGQETDSAQEAEESQQTEAQEASEADAEAAEAESAEAVEEADHVSPQEQGLELGPVPEEVKPQNTQDDTYQLLQDKNTQKLLERLMGNQMYTQLLNVLDPRDERFPLA